MLLRKHELYMTWANIKTRCYNKNNGKYKNYGGRGIKMCDEWVNSFSQFLIDMGERPTNKHSVGRIDNNGDYTPDNCRWETANEQMNNTTKNKLVTYNGETKTYSEWAKTLGLKYSTFRQRLLVYGWNIEKIINTGCIKDCKRKIIYNGKEYTAYDIERKYGVNKDCLFARIDKLKWSVKKSIETPVRNK